MNNLATSTVTVHDLVDVLTSLTIETVAVLSANSKEADQSLNRSLAICSTLVRSVTRLGRRRCFARSHTSLWGQKREPALASAIARWRRRSVASCILWFYFLSFSAR